MKKYLFPGALVLSLVMSSHLEARGFGGGGARGFSGGSFGGGGAGFRTESAGGYRSESFGGYSSGGYRSTEVGGSRGVGTGYSTYSGYRGASGYGGVTNSYDRSYTGAKGGSVDVEGNRGAVYGPRGVAAGGSRDVTATGPDGRTYSGESKAGVAAGPYGRVIGGSEKAGVATGPHGTVAAGSRDAFAGTRFPTDAGLAHYSSFGAAGVHTTSYWSHGYVTNRAGYVRTGFGYYNCFRPGWYTSHPGCWYPAAWAANYAWRYATWPMYTGWYGISAAPIDYDYGNTVVYNNNNIYVNGQDMGSADAYAQQATALVDQGVKAQAPPEQEWRPLGVFALVQGDDKTSNNIFQLAANKDGVLRGNYYDGLMDSTVPVYGSIDPKTQRAAWSIGTKKDRIFEAGIYNLTKSETPCLIHFGTDRTQQALLVRMEDNNGK